MNSRSYNKLSAANDKMDSNTRANNHSNGASQHNQSGLSTNPSAASKPEIHSRIPSDKKSHHKMSDPADKNIPSHATNNAPNPCQQWYLKHQEKVTRMFVEAALILLGVTAWIAPVLVI